MYFNVCLKINQEGGLVGSGQLGVVKELNARSCKRTKR